MRNTKSNNLHLTSNECREIYNELEMRIPFIKDVNTIVELQKSMHEIVRYQFDNRFYPFNKSNEVSNG